MAGTFHMPLVSFQLALLRGLPPDAQPLPTGTNAASDSQTAKLQTQGCVLWAFQYPADSGPQDSLLAPPSLPHRPGPSGPGSPVCECALGALMSSFRGGRREDSLLLQGFLVGTVLW